MRTVVTREAEWDDFERAKMQALVEYELQLCECGMHQSVADEDPDLEMTVRVCPVCAGIAKSMRILATQDEKVLEGLRNAPPDAERPDDGRHIALKQKAPALSASSR